MLGLFWLDEIWFFNLNSSLLNALWKGLYKINKDFEVPSMQRFGINQKNFEAELENMASDAKSSADGYKYLSETKATFGFINSSGLDACLFDLCCVLNFLGS